jgi:Ca2+-binding EF-hand superfamily protein
MRALICLVLLCTLPACGRVAPVAATQVRAGQAAARVVAPFQLFDLDDDGRISRGEALAANYGAAARGWTVAQRREHVLALFKGKNPDAGLDAQEWVNGPATLQPLPPDAQAIERLRDLFFDADTDSDGRLGVAEMTAAKAYAPPGGWTRAERAAAITDLIGTTDYDHDGLVSFDETLWLVHEPCMPDKVPTASVTVKKR